MNKKELIEKILNDNNIKAHTVEELQNLLDKELSKPDMDSSLVFELSMAIIEAKGQEPLTADIDEVVNNIEETRKAENSKFHMPKWSVALAAACLVLVFGNVYSVSAWDMNIFSFIVELTKGGVEIDYYDRKKEIRTPVSDDDPYGIVAICKENGINMETPHYIPDKLVLTHMEHENEEGEKYLSLTYKHENQKLHFMFQSFDGEPFGIPSDEHNISEIEICGHAAIMSREDNQMIVAFNSGEYLCTIMTNNIDYKECDKIINEIR